MRRRLRLVREELLLQRRLCRFSVSHSRDDWSCLNCINLDCRDASNELEMKGLAGIQIKEQAIWDRMELDYQERRSGYQENVRAAARRYAEAQEAVLQRVSSTNGRIVARNSDSLSLNSDDLCLDELVVEPPAEEPPQETDASRSISTS